MRDFWIRGRKRRATKAGIAFRKKRGVHTEKASQYRVKARARAGHSMRGTRKGGNIHPLRGENRQETT